jgi:hypothetical protein
MYYKSVCLSHYKIGKNRSWGASLMCDRGLYRVHRPRRSPSPSHQTLAMHGPRLPRRLLQLYLHLDNYDAALSTSQRVCSLPPAVALNRQQKYCLQPFLAPEELFTTEKRCSSLPQQVLFVRRGEVRFENASHCDYHCCCCA